MVASFRRIHALHLAALRFKHLATYLACDVQAQAQMLLRSFVVVVAAVVLEEIVRKRVSKSRRAEEDEDEIDYRFLTIAAKEAEAGMKLKEGGPFGAVVVRNGQVIAQAHNQVLKLNDPTAHAEIVAIQNACKALGKIELSDCIMYSSCEPCPMSFAAMYLARIPRLVYGAQAEAAHDLGFDSSHIADAIRGTSTFQKTECTVKRIVHPEVAKVFWKHRTDVQIY